MIVVIPSCCCSSRSSTWSCSRRFASSADSGSSSRNSFGARARARAVATRWRCPPESCEMRRSPIPSKETSLSSSSTRTRLSRSPTPRIRMPYAMFPATERCGNSASVWKTIPMSRRCGGRSVMSARSRWTRPSVGFSSPAIIRSIVVLPHPDGPRNEISLPGGSSRSTPATASTSPKCLTSPSSFSPLRASTSRSLREHHLRPLLVDEVLELVVDLVLWTERSVGTGTTDRLVLLLGEVHRFLPRGRCGAERSRQLRLHLGPAEVVDERDAAADVFGRPGHRPEPRVQDRALVGEHASQWLALRRRERRDVVIELPERHLPRVERLLRLRLVAVEQLDVRLDLLKLRHHLDDAVLGVEDVVAVEVQRRGDLEQIGVRRVPQQGQLVLPFGVPERAPTGGTLRHPLGIRDDRDVPRHVADAGDEAVVGRPDVALGDVVGVREVRDVVRRQDVAVDRALDPHPGEHRDVGRWRSPGVDRLLQLDDPDLRRRLFDGFDLDAGLLRERRIHRSEVLLEEPAVRADLDAGALEIAGRDRGRRRAGAASRLLLRPAAARRQQRRERKADRAGGRRAPEQVPTSDPPLAVHHAPPLWSFIDDHRGSRRRAQARRSYLRLAANSAMSSYAMCEAATAVISAWSYAGATSTMSAPARSRPRRPRRMPSISRLVMPPASGVPVPGANAGSSASISI